MHNLEKINNEVNRKLVDRSRVFYWQTDRNIDPEAAGRIWADRHKYFKDDELMKTVNGSFGDDSLVSLKPLDLDAQTNLGNVNSVRVGTLASGKDIIIRNHPRGVENGYFHAESLASSIAKKNRLPSYGTITIHDIDNVDDHAFQVIELLPGIAIAKWLEEHPEDEQTLLREIGKSMAKLNSIPVKGFGPFDNKKAANGELQGIHDTFESAVNASLDFNCDVLKNEDIFSQSQVEEIKKLFEDNPLLKYDKSVLVHNDFADWNLLTDGEQITGILDFDECVGGHPVSEIACWSTFFEPSRLSKMLDGYWSETVKPENFDKIFQLLRFRYTISKMTLRIRRYNWDPSELMKEKIEIGKIHLKESMKYFEISS